MKNNVIFTNGVVFLIDIFVIIAAAVVIIVNLGVFVVVFVIICNCNRDCNLLLFLLSSKFDALETVGFTSLVSASVGSITLSVMENICVLFALFAFY